MATGSQADVNLEGDSAFMQILGLSFEEVGPERRSSMRGTNGQNTEESIT
jgi:hypothetical protein